jgi:thioredoxin reductase (NADPH)
VAEGSIRAVWDSRVTEIVGEDVVVESSAGTSRLHADHVFLMTGFAPSVELLKQVGVSIDTLTGIPAHDPKTLETNVPGIFIAGVVTAGYDANKVFIENGRFHGDQIVARLLGKPAPPPAKISRDLDS